MSQSVVTVGVSKSEFRTNKLANPSPPSDPTADTAQGSVTVYSLEGFLPDGRYLTHPVVVWVEYDDGEFLVTEPHFYMHASGSTAPEAIEAFKRIFSGYLDVLSTDEATLGTYLREQLEYLRSVIKIV